MSPPCDAPQHPDINTNEKPHYKGADALWAQICWLLWDLFHFSWNIRHTEESENAQPYQNLKASNNHNFVKQNLEITQPKRHDQKEAKHHKCPAVAKKVTQVKAERPSNETRVTVIVVVWDRTTTSTFFFFNQGLMHYFHAFFLALSAKTLFPFFGPQREPFEIQIFQKNLFTHNQTAFFSRVQSPQRERLASQWFCLGSSLHLIFRLSSPCTFCKFNPAWSVKEESACAQNGNIAGAM